MPRIWEGFWAAWVAVFWLFYDGKFDLWGDLRHEFGAGMVGGEESIENKKFIKLEMGKLRGCE